MSNEHVHPTILAAMAPMLLHMKSEPVKDAQKEIQEMADRATRVEAQLRNMLEQHNANN